MSRDARAEILQRIRAALGDVPAGEAPGSAAIPRDYRRGDDRDRDALAALLCARVRDYAADAERIAAGEIGESVTRACAQRGLTRLAVAPGVPGAWLPGAGVETVTDAQLPAGELDRIGAVLTGCALAIAETGTLVLDGRPPSGRRALTLVPDHHICVVAAEQVVGQVPEAIAALRDAVTAQRVPVTFVSGSSATSDIELQRVEGVHGPRDLLVLIAG